MFFQQNMSGKLLRFSTELPFVFYVQGRMAGVDANDTQLDECLDISNASVIYAMILCFKTVIRSDSSATNSGHRRYIYRLLRSPADSPQKVGALGDELLPLERWLVWCPLNSLCIHQECALAPGQRGHI